MPQLRAKAGPTSSLASVDQKLVGCLWETLLAAAKPRAPACLSMSKTIQQLLSLLRCHSPRERVSQVSQCTLLQRSDCPSCNSVSAAMASNAATLLGQRQLRPPRVCADRSMITKHARWSLSWNSKRAQLAAWGLCHLDCTHSLQ